MRCYHADPTANQAIADVEKERKREERRLVRKKESQEQTGQQRIPLYQGKWRTHRGSETPKHPGWTPSEESEV